MTKIMMLIKTSDIELDDRLKKEIFSLKQLNKSVVIRAVIQNNNATTGNVYTNIPFKTYRLISRCILPQKRFLALKALEMYFYFAMAIIRLKPEIVWLHNIEMIGLFSFLKWAKRRKIIAKIIWDQHELPMEQYFSSQKKKLLLQNAFYKCDILTVANLERLEYLKSLFRIPDGRVILNLPDAEFIYTQKTELRKEFRSWIHDRQYFITSGMIDENMRYISNIAEAVLNTDEFCLIVIGPYTKATIKQIEERSGVNIRDRILFTGLVKHDVIMNLTDHAFCSMVFYNINRLNNEYCAPNRLYQAIVRGVPLITGCNPHMAHFINENHVGVALNSDGRNICEISEAITIMNKKRDTYVANLLKINHKFNWNLNLPVLEEISSLNKSD